MKVGVVLNPVAGGGRLRRGRTSIEAALARHFGAVELVETRAAGEACGLARDMALEGAELVIAAGGDGTARPEPAKAASEADPVPLRFSRSPHHFSSFDRVLRR